MPDTHLGAALRLARLERGWSLRQAEAKTGVSNAHISQIEHGTIRKPSLTVLAALAGGYGIPLKELVEAAGIRAPALVVPGEAAIRASERAQVISELEAGRQSGAVHLLMEPLMPPAGHITGWMGAHGWRPLKPGTAAPSG